MDHLISAAIALFGTLGALVAFGGETWLKGISPLHKRITWRGWVAVVCLLSTACLAVYKETHGIRAARTAAAEVAEAREQRDAFQKRLNQITKELGEKLDDWKRQASEFQRKWTEEAASNRKLLSENEGLLREIQAAQPVLFDRARQEIGPKGEIVQILSATTGKPVELMGGDELRYQLTSEQPRDRKVDLYLVVNAVRYMLGDIDGQIWLHRRETEGPYACYLYNEGSTPGSHELEIRFYRTPQRSNLK